MRLNSPQKGVYTNYAYFPVIIDEKTFGANRDEVKEALERENIGARKYFYPLTNTFECFHGKYDVSDTPVAEKISKKVLTLPFYADLELKDVDRICDIVTRCKR